MVSEVQASNGNLTLEQWPYSWELTNADQTKKVTVIGQCYLTAANQYPQEIQKKAFNARVLVSELPPQVALDIHSKGFLRWVYQQEIQPSFVLVEFEKRLQACGYSNEEEQKIKATIQKINTFPKDWHQGLSTEQKIEIQEILQQFDSSLKFEDAHPGVVFDILNLYEEYQQFLQNNLLTDSVVENQKNRSIYFPLDDQTFIFYKKVIRDNLGTLESTIPHSSFPVVDDKMIFDHILKNPSLSSIIENTQFDDLCENIIELLGDIEDERGNSVYFQEAKTTHHIAMSTLINNHYGSYGEKRLATWKERLIDVIDKHDNVTIIADVESMKSQNGILGILQDMGFDEAKKEATS